MSPHQSHREPPEPDDIAELLEQAFSVDEPREEFVTTLFDLLDRKFDAVRGHAGAEISIHHCNGHAKVVAFDPDAGLPTSSEGRTIDEIRASGTRPISARRPVASRRRWYAGIGLAASVLAAMVLANLEPKYTWASMVEAIRAQTWVQAVAATDEGTPRRGWISWVHGVVARRSEGEVIFDNLADGMRNRYRVDERVIYREPLPGEAPRSAEQALLDFVLHGPAPTDDGGRMTAESVNIISESWQEVRVDEDKWIKLDVRLRSSESANARDVSFLIDPETHLPVTVQLAGRTNEGSLEYRLSYPQEGPREVHSDALGVPSDAPVKEVAARPISERELNTTPAESVAGPIAQEEGQTFVVEESVVAPLAEALPSATEAASSVTEESVAGDDAGPLPPAASDEEMSRRIDELMAACWSQHGIRPVEAATDGEYLRRVYLDLTGRIPTVSEVRDFMDDSRPGRRTLLLDDLLGRYDHATHLAAVWRRFLLPDGVDLSRYGGPEEFERWLADHFRKNTPYDQIVRELLLAEGRVTESGPLMFYTALRLQPEELAGQSARAFLGTRMECAQCHDHFFDERWTQDDFWAFAAFFARLSQPQGKFDMVSTVLRIQDSNRGEVMLPESEDVVPPRFPEGEDSPDSDSGPARRKRLADWLTARDNDHFARATVNRVWSHLFGKGLVDPVDDMRPDNPAQCPEVLEELTSYFANSGFDLRKLIRTLSLTEAYQVSSSTADDDPSRLLYFAQMNVKTFTAEQLYDCIAVATRLQSMGGGVADQNSVERFDNVSRQEFLEQFRAPPGQATEYHAGIPQALTLMNGRLIEGGTDLRGSGILRSLEAPFFTDAQRVETLFMATLSRAPDDVEQVSMLDYVTSAKDDIARQEAFGDILWVLLNSAEFTLNH
jgi:hypothetical protein